jgi:NADPH:quinone reductase-like Zn-dependent oxidoreductase
MRTGLTMRAVGQEVLGGPEVLRVVEVDRPEPEYSQILVKVHAAGLNPADCKHRALRLLGEPPHTLGWDVSGVVAAVGRGVTIYRPGDEVFGMLPYPYGVGSHAEYVTGPTRAFVRKPPSIGHIQAAALPLAALTAWQALTDTVDVRPGQRVLIHAAAGGVGHLAVQIAKARGAYVIGTASAPKHDFLRSLGVDEVIDYRTTDFTQAVGDIDVVLDSLGGDNCSRSLGVLRRGGTVVSILSLDQPDLTEAAWRRGVRVERMLVEHDHAGMRAIADLARSGRLRAAIADTFMLDEAAKAHELGDSRRTTGKLVLVMR